MRCLVILKVTALISTAAIFLHRSPATEMYLKNFQIFYFYFIPHRLRLFVENLIHVEIYNFFSYNKIVEKYIAKSVEQLESL